MAFDVYQPCPYCTDKKLKFCCADIAEEMEKVGRLSDNGQHRAALKILDKLAVSHPRTVWNQATRATLLMAEGRLPEAKSILETLHGAEPDNQAVIALLATASFGADGYQAARDAIWRAFRKAAGFGDIASSLALGIAGEMFDRGKQLAARQHLTLAMRLAPQRDKQAIFLRLLEFDGNAEIPYPLRSVHSLRDIDGEPDRQDSARKAMRLAERGCFGPAAERFVTLAQATPDDPAVEYNFALCTAWEGNEEIAAEAFGRASLAERDFEVAAEYSALEQFLRASLDEQPGQINFSEYRVAVASKLIGILEQHPRFVRYPLTPESAAAGGPDAVFDLLDRPMPESIDDLQIDALPTLVGQLAVYGNPEESAEPQARLIAFNESAQSLVAEFAADLEVIESNSEPSPTAFPRSLTSLHTRLAFPEKTPAKLRRELERKQWEQAVESWFNSPHDALLGKSPIEAASDEGLRVPLAGAVYVLDAFCLRGRYTLDVNSVRERLKLPPVASIEPEANVPLNTLSAIQLHRLRVADLDDRQLSIVLNRALLIHHGRFLRDVLETAVERNLPEVDRSRILLTLSDLARDRGDLDDALRWIEAGRNEAKSGENAFENVFRWDTKELALRLEDPESPELQPFVRRMANYYGPKIPHFTEHLTQLLQTVGIAPPTILEPVGAAGSGELWTPEQGSRTEEKKLWLPGT